MSTITIYTFEDKAGNEWGAYHTRHYQEAKDYARRTHTRLIANDYQWSSSEAVDGDDYTQDDEEETEPENSR